MEINETARKQELFHYLYNKANGGSDCGGIPEYNLYGGKEPWEIWEGCNGGTQLTERSKDLYVFTKVKKKDARRFCLVGSGVTSSGIENSDGTTTRLGGKEKTFRYRSRTPLAHHWIIIEYSLDASTLRHAKFQDYVLCQIKRVDKSEIKMILEQEEAPGLTVINDKSMDSERVDVCNKRQKISLEGDEGKQPELSCNNDNNGTGPTTVTNTEEVADNDTELAGGDGRANIDLSNDDEESKNGNAQVNNIGATPVEKQLRDGPSIIDLSDDDEECNYYNAQVHNVGAKQLRDGPAIIDLSGDDEEPNNDNAQVNNIVATQVDKQLPSLKSRPGHSDCKESALVSEGSKLSNLNNAVGDRNGDWSDTSAEELLRCQDQPMEQSQIQMIPNLFYQGITGCELLTKKSTSDQE